MIKKSFFILGFLMTINSFSQNNPFQSKMDGYWSQITDNTFDDLVKENNLIVTMPDDFVRVDLKKNYNVIYQYAIKDKSSNFEVRVFIKSFKALMKDTSTFNPNKFSRNSLMSMSLNASGNLITDSPQIDVFPSEAAKNEFNADWGATTAFAPNTEFGKGFNFCALNCFRMNNVCEVYVFYMFDDITKQELLMQKCFYLMKFK